MLFRILKADMIKLRRSPVWLAFLLMPFIPAVLGTANYLANIEILQNGWYSLWTQHTIFTSYIFMPVMLGVYCAYLMRLEHVNNNWNKVLTMPANPALFFLSKVIMASVMLLFTGVWIAVLFAVSGRLAGISAPLPFELWQWILGGVLGGMVMISMQLLLSFIIKSFAVSVGVSLAGGLSGMVCLSKGFGHIYPYSLMAYGMRANNSVQSISVGDYGQFCAVCAVYIALFAVIGGLCVKNRGSRS